MKWIIRTFIVAIWVTLLFTFLRTKENETDVKALHVFTWSNCLTPETMEKFKEKTGIDVHLSYYSSNEEMLTKLASMDGKGYDLIIPSDYAINILKKQNLLKKIDKARIHRFAEIDPLFLDQPFDPKNEHSIPYQWDVLGFGYNSDLISDKEFNPSLELLFKDCGIKPAMTNDPVEAVNLAALYLFGQIDKLSNEQVVEVEKLLKKQKSLIAGYVTMRADYVLATKNVPAAISFGTYVIEAKNHTPSIKFKMPKEGTFFSIESVAIPAASTKEDQAYQLINFMLEDENFLENSNAFASFPTIPLKGQIYQELCDDIRKTLENEQYPKYFFHHIIPESLIRSIWIKVKS